jgi:hypothetical protein
VPAYGDFIKYLESAYQRVNVDQIKSLTDFGYSFYASEMSALNLPDFPVENLDKIVHIMNQTKTVNGGAGSLYDENHLSASKLIYKLYPDNLLLKD